MFLKIDKRVIDVEVANSFGRRLIGLMGRKEIFRGLLIPNCKSIHTFFMRKSIDIIIFDSNNVVLDVKSSLKPWKIYSYNEKIKKTSILELPENTCVNLKINSVLFFENENIV